MFKIHLVNPFDTRRLKHPNYNITQWFDSQKINYVHDENDPDWIIIHVLWGGYLMKHSNILNDLSDNLKYRLRTGKAGLLVWYPYETEHYREENVVAQIEGLDGANHNNCLIRILVTGNLNNKSILNDAHKHWTAIYKKFEQQMSSTSLVDLGLLGTKSSKDSMYLGFIRDQIPKQLWNKIEKISLRKLIRVKEFHEWAKKEIVIDSIISRILYTKIVEPPETIKVPLLFFDWQLITHLKQVGEANQMIPHDWYKWDKQKSFMCLNGKDKKHRRLMLQTIREHELEEYGAISYVCYDGVDSTLNNDAIGGNDLPIILDQSLHQVKKNDRYMNPELYNNCWINIVTEAFPHVEQDLFITEKTFKPMLQLQPFLIQGNRYTLKKLQEFGFKTFPTLFDESYDDLPTVEERTEAIGIQLSKWCKRTYKKEMIKSVWDDLLHNQQMLLNTELDLTRSAYLAEILKAVSVGG